jgi:hypothetical protein
MPCGVWFARDKWLAARRSAIYIMSGILPLQAQIHMKALTLLGSILQQEGKIEHRLAERQFVMVDREDGSWFQNIKNILALYDLPPPLHLLTAPLEKKIWKKQ